MYENIPSVEVNSLEELSQTWQHSEGIACNYFQSFSWQSTWLSLLGNRFNLKFLCIRHNLQVKLLSSLAIGRNFYLGLIPVRTAFLNSVGQQDFDVICTEGCQPIAAKEDRSGYFCRFFEYLLEKEGVAEIVINAVSEDALKAIAESASRLGLLLEKTKQVSHYSVDLQRFRSQNLSHLEVLSGRTRKLVKQSLEDYKNLYGVLSVEHPSSAPQAKEWLQELINLNIKRLSAQDKNSSFLRPFLKEFHFKLIEEAFGKDEIFLAKVSAGNILVGYVYGFVFNNVMSVYQSGFNYEVHRDLRPGLAAHNLLIEEVLANGMNCYDFLAGDYQYKKQLSDTKGSATWVKLRKPKMLFKIDKALRILKRRIVK